MKQLKYLTIVLFSISIIVNSLSNFQLISAQGGSMKNPVTYFEIPVTDIERAATFYKAIFGFEFERQEIDGNDMALFPLIDNATGISGALAKGKTYKRSKKGTLVYFNTENIDETLQKAKRNGGKTLYPKTSIGDLGFVAEFEDSEGNKIALHSQK